VLECRFERLDGFHLNWRTVDEGDHRRVAAAVEDFVQSGLQRTELAACGIRIDDERRAVA